MSYRFLHTADWHIGKSFGAFSAEKRALLSEARLSTIDKIADLAGRSQIADVVVAGDTFDSPKLADGVVRQALHRLAQAKHVTWYMLPGNHDPAVDRGIWDRVELLGRPPNVIVSRRPEVIILKSGVVLLTAPVTSARTMQDPTASFQSLPVEDGVMRVGLAHGSVQQFGSGNAEEATVLIAADRAERDGLDYLALGDWHGQKTVSERTRYSGTPEPESFVENEPGFVLSVTLNSRAELPQVERHATGFYTWSRLDFAFDRLATPLHLLEQLRDIRDSGGRHLLRVKLAGQLSLDDGVALRAELEALGDVLFSLEVDWEQVDLAVQEAGEDLFLDDRLVALADKLSHGRAGDVCNDVKVRRRALELLARFAAASRG